mmetsp:Transcript_8281/g.14840  ORF Transcript_8281/g.14840 Transcript_8281/m.14840 type:complete len:463 (+) Transcript_8281:69-1457(+)
MGASGLRPCSEQVIGVTCTSCADGLRAAIYGKQPSATNGAVDAALLHWWRKETLQRLLPASHVAEHIIGFLGVVDPPPIGMLSDGVHVLCVEKPMRPKQVPPSGSRLICAFAADVNGADIWLTASDSASEGIQVWPMFPPDSPGEHLHLPPILGGLEAPVKSLWLCLAADRAAAGLENGTVQIWDFTVGLLLVSCQPIILESTQWTTVGHTTHVTMLDTAPSKQGAVTKYPRDLRAGKACVLSGDPSGTVCIWRDDGTNLMCCNASFVVQRTFGGKGHTVHSIASSTEDLVICGLTSAVVGFTASLGEVAFVLSSPESAMVRDPISAVQYIPCLCHGDGVDLPPHQGLVVVAKNSGEIAQWNLATLEREGKYLQAKRPKVLRRGRSSIVGLATSHKGELAWLGISDCGLRLTMAWLRVGGCLACSERSEDDAVVFEKNYHVNEAMSLPSAIHLFPSKTAPEQ